MKLQIAKTRPHNQLLRALIPGVTIWFVMASAIAQDIADNVDEDSSAEVLDEIIVTVSAVRRLDLQSISSTGSRLGLSAFETPATIDIIGSETMRARGLLSVTEAAESLVGVSSGENPAAPSAFSMRGFTDNQITALRDGLRIGPASMVMRPQNTFNLERVEILKGPASVLYGEGSVAGSINAVTKKPKLGADSTWNLLATYGEFDTYQTGIGTGGSFSDTLAYRFDASRTGSDGWVDRTPSNSTNFTGSLLKAFSDTFEASIGFDYLDDDLPNNWGQPLLPDAVNTRTINGVVIKSGESIDVRDRFTNFNVGDDLSESESLWLNAKMDWRPSDKLTISSNVYSFDADRHWRNAEQYIYADIDGEDRITRDRFFVTHDQEIVGVTIDATLLHMIGDRESTLVFGVDYNDIDFSRIKAFPDSDDVALVNPASGGFGAITESKKGRAQIETTALFFEHTIRLSERLRLVTGGRQETIDLDRDDFSWSPTMGGGDLLDAWSFDSKFTPFSARAGLVFDISDEIVAYSQFSTGKDPAGTELFSVEANEQFKLASSEMWELGVKASLNNGRTEITAAYFDILREDLTVQASIDEFGDPVFANVGSQESNGIEFAFSTFLTDNWQASFNAAYTNANYGEVTLPWLGDATGNTPPNIGEWTANAWTGVSDIAGLPLEIGAGVRYIDDRYADVANEILLKGYVLVSAYAAYNFENFRVMLRGRNLTDEEYVPWVSPWYTNQVALGAPRSVEVSFEANF